MEHFLKNWFPAFASAMLFIFAEILDIYGLIPLQQRSRIEVLFNSILILIAVCGFWITLNLPDLNDTRKNVLGNILIPVIAFPINIDIFGHTIHFHQIFPDLWGWHLFWLIVAIVQILVLTKLGKKLIHHVLKFLTWGKNITGSLGNIITGFANSMENSNKPILLIITAGIALWSCYLYTQLHGSNIKEVLSDNQFLGNNLKFWIAYVIIGLLIYAFQPLAQNVRNALQQADIKAILLIITAITALVTVSYLFPVILSLIEIIIAALSLPLTGFMLLRYFYHKKKKKKKKGKKQKKKESIINKPDLYFVLAIFICPLIGTLLFGILTSSDSPLTTTPDLSKATTWLNYLDTAANAAKSILQLLSLD